MDKKWKKYNGMVGQLELQQLKTKTRPQWIKNGKINYWEQVRSAHRRQKKNGQETNHNM